MLFTGTAGLLDDIPLNRIAEFETRFLEYMEDKQKKILPQIKKEKRLSDEVSDKLKKAVEEFKKIFLT